MNFNLVEMYNGLLRFNKHILNELAEGLKHLPNLDGVSNSNNFITEFDFRFGPYFIPNKVGTNKKADYNWIRGNNGQDTDKAVRVLLLGGIANNGSDINYINMKRYSGLHDKLCTIENIEVADDNARKNKNKKYGINKHDKNRKENVKPQT